MLVLITRAAAATVAVSLLVAHRVTDVDGTLIVIVVSYTALISLLAIRWPGTTRHPAAWAADMGVLLGLVAVSGDWRSPLYLLSLTTLAAPAAALGVRRGVLIGLVYALAYAIIAHRVGPDPFDRSSQSTVETFATHLFLPLLVAFGSGHVSETMRKLHAEQRRSQRLAVQAERRRIAWELHDSAKQRIHAAHLVLSAAEDRDHAATQRALAQALNEIQAAAADMDTSLAELRSPLEGRALDEALRERGGELCVANGPTIEVTGQPPRLLPADAAHAYRIAAEAITNAVRHARATRIEVRPGAGDAGNAMLTVSDDGCGIPAVVRPGSTGLLAMRNRARTIGGRLTVERGADGRGTVVSLRVSASQTGETSS
jgi:signal transduction histidine kinase